jgi:hypothetical protein
MTPIQNGGSSAANIARLCISTLENYSYGESFNMTGLHRFQTLPAEISQPSVQGDAV